MIPIYDIFGYNNYEEARRQANLGPYPNHQGLQNALINRNYNYCPYCGRSFSDPNQLWTVVNQMTPEMEMYENEWYDRRLKQRWSDFKKDLAVMEEKWL